MKWSEFDLGGRSGLRHRKAWIQIAAVTLSGNSLRPTVHTLCAKLVAALFRVARLTAGLAESNGSLSLGLWLTSAAGLLRRTGISPGTLRSAVEYWLSFPLSGWPTGGSTGLTGGQSLMCVIDVWQRRTAQDARRLQTEQSARWPGQPRSSARGQRSEAWLSAEGSRQIPGISLSYSACLLSGHITELYIVWCELSRGKLSPTLATAHYSSPDNAVGLVAQFVLSGYVKLGWLLDAVAWKFSHRPGNPAKVGVVWWPFTGDTAGYRLRRPKLTPVSLISMGRMRVLLALVYRVKQETVV